MIIFKLLLQYAVLIIGLSLGIPLLYFLTDKLPATPLGIVVSCVVAGIYICLLMKGLGCVNNFLMGLFK